MIPQHYPIEAGKIYGGEYPGDRNPDVAKIIRRKSRNSPRPTTEQSRVTLIRRPLEVESGKSVKSRTKQKLSKTEAL